MIRLCFIDKDGMPSVCIIESLGGVTGKKEGEIDCNKCWVRKKYKGKEKEYFISTRWTGELNEQR